MQNEFIAWLSSQLEERGWSIRELARRANSSPSTIASIANGSRKPGADACAAIAKALDVSPDDVFRLAGILPPSVASEQLSGLDLAIYRELEPVDDDFKETVLAIIKDLKVLYGHLKFKRY